VSYRIFSSLVLFYFSLRLSFVIPYIISQELDLVEEGGNIYKLVGPVLMSVDVEEARHNVTKRMEFIEKDMNRLDDTIAARQGEQSALGEEIQKLQQETAADAATAAREVATKALRDD
jgi:prefoldin beta subunit